MFKSATIYRIIQQGHGSFDDLPAFVPCGSVQEKSIGWIPPLGHDNGPLVEFVAGQHILKLMIETKAVPSEVIQRKVDEQIAHIEQTTGRKAGRKEMRELKEDVRLALLPMTFSKRAAFFVWFDEVNNLLVIDSASQARCDDVVTMLVKSLDGLALQLINTQNSPTSSMAQWLTSKEGPQHFTIDRECELKAFDESKAVVKYGRHALDIDEVGEHIAQGKLPTKLALTWDDRVSFILTDAMTLKNVELLDTVLDDGSAEHADGFDTDVTLVTGELSVLIKDLLDALGGEIKIN